MSINEKNKRLIDFCLPVKNEEKILEANALRLFDFLESQKLEEEWRIVVIVNGSNDNSRVIAQKLVDEKGQRFKLYYVEKGGKGLALKQYFKISQADILVFMDIDLAVSLANLPSLLSPICGQKSDLVIGSRLLPGSQINRSFWRSLVSHSYNIVSRLILGHNLSDLQCGFKALTKELFNRIQPFLFDDGWFFDTELVIFASHFNYRVEEIPVNWREDRYDDRKSKIRVFVDVWAFIKNLFLIRGRLCRIKKYPGSV